MRLLVARCTVRYEGRLEAVLPEALRLIMVKADGCVAVHADSGAYKPLNWMNSPNTLIETAGEWVVTNPKGERLVITLHEVLSEMGHELGAEPGLEKDGVEAQLQVLLADKCEAIQAGLTLVRREYPTHIGPVDLLCKDADGVTVAVEIKRRGDIDGVEQLTRYLSEFDMDARIAPVRGMLVAQEIKPQARVLAERRGIVCVQVDYDELRQRPSNALRLFEF